MCNLKKKSCKDKPEKGIYAPSYYSEFKCIAEKCRHSCCIDWEICIDEATYEKYKQAENILGTVKECEEGYCFALREDGRCPHLNGAGLCNIILTNGEDYLSDICKNHPRFFNCISDTRTEAGYGIVCEEACRLILESEKPFLLSKIDEPHGEAECDGAYFNALPSRDYIVSVIEGKENFEEKLSALKREFEISDLYTADEWLDRFLSLEILDVEWEKCLIDMRGHFLHTEREMLGEYGKYYERLLLYFVYRHVSMADSLENLCARLGFCILSVEVIRSLFEYMEFHTLETLIDISRRYSAEIEYSEDNTDELIFAFESRI